MTNFEATLPDVQIQEIPKKWYGRIFEFFDNPLASVALAFIIYAGMSYRILTIMHLSIFKASYAAYFNYLADAFLHGQLNLRLIPDYLLDLSLFNGNYYLYWSPMPAILMMPFIAIFGVGFNDYIFTLGIGAINVGLIAVLLKRACQAHILDLTKMQRGLLVAFFAFGTVHMTLAPIGRVWFTGQLVGFFFTVLAYLAAISLVGFRAWVLTGLALAGALLTRNELVLVGVWPAVYLLIKHYDRRKLWRLAGMVVSSALPILLAVAALGVYNYLRFGSFLDNGIPYHRMSVNFQADYIRYGLFNLYYLPTNFFYEFIAYPFLDPDHFVMGGSLFLLSPIFLAAFWGIVKGKPRWSTIALTFSIMLTAIPILLLMGTGWIQFGPRYTLDFTVPLLILTAMGLPYWKQSILVLLTLISWVHFLIGTYYLGIVIYRGI
jgi:hypothetical protein